MMALAKVLALLGLELQPIDDLLVPPRRTFAIGEMNSKVPDKDFLMGALARTFHDGRQDRFDGITIECDDWWFNVRTSNKEPFLRLNLEDNTREFLEVSGNQIYALLGRPV